MPSTSSSPAASSSPLDGSRAPDRRARPRPAGRRDRLPGRRRSYGHRHGPARQPGAAPGPAGLRGAVGHEPVDLAHADRGIGPPRRRGQRQPTAAARPASAHAGPDPCRRQRAAGDFRRAPDASARPLRPGHAARRGQAPATCCRPAWHSTAPRRRAPSTRSKARTDYVLFLADDELTPWSEKAIRQADLVLAVGWHAAGERANALERLAAELLPPRRAAAGAAARDARAHRRHGALARWTPHRHAPPRRARRARRFRRALPASCTAPRSALSRAAAAPTARPISACTRRCCSAA